MSFNIPTTSKKRIVIIGGGFGGLRLVEDLTNTDYQVVLIDKNNFHQFQPLFYQVATAGLEPSSISFPFRKVFQKAKNVHFRMAEVRKIDPELKHIETSIGELSYDYLVMATGAGNNFFGNKNIEEKSMPMKSISEALALRNSIFERMERALTSEDESRIERNLTIVVVGGGPTGVEVAGTLAEMKNYILPKDYPEIEFSKMKIYLIEGTSRVLNAMSDISSQKAAEYLKKLGVEVVLNTFVEDYDGSQVTLKSGEIIQANTLVWAAGIKGNTINGFPEDVYGPGGRMWVDTSCRLKNYPEVFIVGDVALMEGNTRYPKGHPQMAQVAIQQGKNVAKNLIRIQKNEPMKAFRYKNLGSMATVGRNKAVVELPGRKFQGFFAWLVWMVVHLRSILGVKNKFIIFLNWVWNYFTYNLSLRLIIHNKEKDLTD
jgi:NADH dehydrogenase